MQPASIVDSHAPIADSLGVNPQINSQKSGSYRGYTGSRRGNAQRGRLELIGFFVVLRALDLLVYFTAPANERTQILGVIFTCALWTTAALAGVWMREGWCRWALMACLFGSVVATSCFLKSSFDLPLQFNHFVIPFIIAIVDAAIAWAVIGSRDIRRLVSRSHTAKPYGYR
jgi:hypothetical protein